tara:strand:+ start:531 stop:1076 length:546 start_codon:yes stop_codon:yes gene_type:complete
LVPAAQLVLLVSRRALTIISVSAVALVDHRQALPEWAVGLVVALAVKAGPVGPGSLDKGSQVAQAAHQPKPVPVVAARARSVRTLAVRAPAHPVETAVQARQRALPGRRLQAPIPRATMRLAVAVALAVGDPVALAVLAVAETALRALIRPTAPTEQRTPVVEADPPTHQAPEAGRVAQGS